MVANLTDSVWLELEDASRAAEAGTRAVFRRLLPESRQDLFAGVTCGTTTRFFQVMLATSESGLDISTAPPMDGINVRLLGDARRRTTAIEISLAKVELGDIFTVLVNDLALHLVENDLRARPSTLLLERLRHWQALLRGVPDGLDLQRRRGLVGELWMLQRLMSIVGVERALYSWSGPEGSDQDFQLEHVAIEVKTSAARDSGAITISSERQLDSPDGVTLFLVCWQIDERLGTSGVSLPALVQSLREQFIAGLRTRFETRLASCGYFARDAARYDQPRYAQRAELICRVSENFPRIVQRSVPQGIGSVRYDVALSAMRPFAVEHAILETTLGAAGA